MASLLPLCHRLIHVYTPQPVTRGDRHWESQKARSVLRAQEDPQACGLLWGCRTWHHLIKTMLPLINSPSPLWLIRGSGGSGLWAAVRAQLQRQVSRWKVAKKKCAVKSRCVPGIRSRVRSFRAGRAGQKPMGKMNKTWMHTGQERGHTPRLRKNEGLEDGRGQADWSRVF